MEETKTETIQFDFENESLTFEIGELNGRTYVLHRNREKNLIIVARYSRKTKRATKVISARDGFLPGMKSMWEAKNTNTALIHVSFCLGGSI